jgi:hypothetical protein
MNRREFNTTACVALTLPAVRFSVNARPKFQQLDLCSHLWTREENIL